MNKSILIYGAKPTADQLWKLVDHFGLVNVITEWKHTDKFPRVNTLVVTETRPASFNKRDPRVFSVEDALKSAKLT